MNDTTAEQKARELAEYDTPATSPDERSIPHYLQSIALSLASRSSTQQESPQMGGWVVYDYDNGPYAISLHVSAEDASKSAARQGYGKVGWWPFGEGFRDAIKEWESPIRDAAGGTDE